MGRQVGFYWVRTDDEWEIARWYDGMWWTCGWEVPVAESSLDEIDERRLVHP
jgi:hypothetical protein